MRRTLPLSLILGALAGCPSSHDPPPCNLFLGSAAVAPTLSIVLRTVDGRLVDAVDGQTAPLIFPPQGGFILLAGPRVNNVDGCNLQVTAALRDECTGRILGLESRPVRLVADTNGTGIPESPMELSDYANIASCPTAAAARDVDGTRYRIDMHVVDRTGRTADAQVHVVPVCAEAIHESACRCECAAGYQLGDVCQPIPDAGPVNVTCPSDAGMGMPDAGRPDAH